MNSEIHARIRRAVSAGEFAKASALWETYGLQVTDAIRGGAFSAAELVQLRELIDWTRCVVICARAQGQRRMNTRTMKLHAAAAYGRPSR